MAKKFRVIIIQDMIFTQELCNEKRGQHGKQWRDNHTAGQSQRCQSEHLKYIFVLTGKILDNIADLRIPLKYETILQHWQGTLERRSYEDFTEWNKDWI